jgi:hypothetical protein
MSNNQTKQDFSGLNYKTGFNANRQAVNSGQASSDLMRRSLQAPPVMSNNDAQRAYKDVQQGLYSQNNAQMNRSDSAMNAQQSVTDMADRNQLMQQGVANQAKIYQDLAQRSVSQTGLAAQLNAAMVRNKFAVLQNQVGQGKKLGQDDINAALR